ncbi:MAG: ABC transporter permease [Clostridia bacterium]|nr:ABC transporter permease [Clostridia bacterium]
MIMEKTVIFEPNRVGKRVKSMLRVDFRRMFKMPLLYIIVAVCLVMPILILVMTTMMDGTVSVDPQTGAETVIEGFDNVWQIIGSVSSDTGASSDAAAMGAGMSLTSMCNVNMLYFAIAVLVCVFVAEDFRSGYAKNLFTVRAKKSDYVLSKTLVCSAGAALMILAFFVGSLLGGAIAGLPFDMVGFGIVELVMCVLSKMLLVTVFVPIYLIMSVAAKQRLWLSLILSFMVGMFLFMMIPLLTPLNATALNVLLCLAGGALFGIGLGAISNLVLKKTSLV